MTDQKLTQLNPATTLTGTELLYGVQSGVQVKITANQIKTFTGSGGGGAASGADGSVQFATAGAFNSNNSQLYFNNSATGLATNTNVALNVNTSGDFTGTDAINIYGQYDAYLLNSQITNSLVGLNTDGAFPGYTTSSSRGTSAAIAQLQAGDIVGGYFGFGAQGATSPTYQNLGGMAISTIGSSVNNLGGQLDFYAKADGGSLVDTMSLTNNGSVAALTLYSASTKNIDGYDSSGSAVITRISSINTVNHTSGTLSFQTANNSSLSTGLFIDRTGFVGLSGSGIGALAPTHTLTLPSTSTGIAYYNTTDQTTNYERVRQFWSSNVYTISSEQGGTGLQRDILITQGASKLTVGGGTTPSAAGIELRRDATSVTQIATVTSSSLISSSAIQNALSIVPTYNQTATGGARLLFISPLLTAVGSGGSLLIDAGTNSLANGLGTHTSRFSVDTSGNTTVGTLTSGPAVFGSSSTNIWNPATGSITGSTNTQYLFAGATTIDFRIGIGGTNSSTIIVGAPYGNLLVGMSPLTTAASGTHAMLANLVVTPIGTVTNSGATVTRTASLYIQGVSTATVTDSNYAVYVNSANVPFTIDGAGVAMGQMVQLFRVNNLNSTTTANTLAYTNNTGKTISIAQVAVVCTAATAITTGPAIGIGTAAGTSDMIPSTAMNALTTTNRQHYLPSSGGSVVVPNGGTIYINLTAATGTSQTVTLAFAGFAF